MMLLVCSVIPILLLTTTWGLRDVAASDVQFLDDVDELSNHPFLASIYDDGNTDSWESSPRRRALRPSIFSDSSDPWPIVSLDYGGMHPFERKLQSTSDVYRPLDITFITDLLDARLGEDDGIDQDINSIINILLPQVQSIWSSHLSVVPNTKTIPITSSDCFGLARQLPSSVFENGVTNTDLVIITSAFDTVTDSNGNEIDFCTSRVLASAFGCATDQFDRPVIGYINFCLGNTTSSRRQLQTEESNTQATIDRRRAAALTNDDDNVVVVLHEIGHVLGMSSQRFAYFRDPTTGEPLTPRPVAVQDVTCTDGEVRSVRLASTNTLQIGTTDKGLIYYDVVTPRVQQVVRNHFNCPSLNGARLENFDTNPNACTGSHWSERLFFGELMQPIIFPGSLVTLSPLTLALLEDSGWYRVNYTHASPIAFGQGAGCDFVNRDCIVNDAVPDAARDFFCSSVTRFSSNGRVNYNETDVFCDPLHYQLVLCKLFDAQEIPAALADAYAPDGVEVSYFSDPNLLGYSAQGDFCPTLTYRLRVDCTDSTTDANVRFEGEQYGDTSRCINIQYDSIFGRLSNTAGCFETTCDATTRKVVVNGVTCDYDFQELTIRTASNIPVTMICPRLSTICPELTACPNDCSGWGTCNSDVVPPTCECLNTSDTSSNCGKSEVGGLTSYSGTTIPMNRPFNNGTTSTSNNGTTSTSNNGTTSTSNNGTTSTSNNGTTSTSNNGPASTTKPSTSAASSIGRFRQSSGWIYAAMGTFLLFAGNCVL